MTRFSRSRAVERAQSQVAKLLARAAAGRGNESHYDLYRTVARYRLDQLLPMTAATTILAAPADYFRCYLYPRRRLAGNVCAGLWRIWGRSSLNLASYSPHAGIFCPMTSQTSSRCYRIRLLPFRQSRRSA